MRYPEIAEEILAMCKVDQDMRHKNVSEPDYWDESVDRRHTSRMKELVDEIGWPTIPKVGPDASCAVELLVRHADHDVAFQAECLALMKSAPDIEVEKNCIAYLEDRVRVNSKQLQLYGTQFTEVNGNFVPREIENPERVDERRLGMGLGTLQDGIKHMHEKYRV